MKPAVFLDRDGTLLEEAGYLDRLERLVFFPFSVDAVRLLNRAGFAVVVITNQAGIARGIVKESFVAGAPAASSTRLAAGGARSTASTTARIIPTRRGRAYRRDCDCRKPRPGHAAQAAARSRHRSRALVRRRRPVADVAGRARGRRAGHSRADRATATSRSARRAGTCRPPRSSTT